MSADARWLRARIAMFNWELVAQNKIVIAGLDPAIHGSSGAMDPRIKSAGDGFVFGSDSLIGGRSFVVVGRNDGE